MATPRISVICVTNRPGFENILADDMNRQTFRDFEVIVADDNYHGQNSPFDIHFKPRQKSDGDVWNLNKAYNDAISKARGRLLIFLQDYIWIPSNGLERFWDDYEMFPDALVTGVGHKALHGLEGISETDNRVFGDDDIVEANYSYWELNWASCPKTLMPSFNEDMDRFYGGENQYIARKAALNGARVLIDRRNQCIGYSQDYCGGRPEDWEVMHSNKGPLTRFMDDLESEYKRSGHP